VTDTLLIAKHADTFIYVARANFWKACEYCQQPIQRTEIAKHVSALNDTDSTKGYGYGYGYEAVKKNHGMWLKI
jgi:hypothetical protein